MVQAKSEAIEVKTARHGEVINELDEVKALKVQLEQEREQRKVDRTDAGAVIQKRRPLSPNSPVRYRPTSPRWG